MLSVSNCWQSVLISTVSEDACESKSHSSSCSPQGQTHLSLLGTGGTR